MVVVTQIGITKKEIPYEAQIIRVADEYDAIVTKRQYKTHINISETLKDLIKDTKPDPKFVALDQLSVKEKSGKINGLVLSKLFKVVIDDTLYEISGIMDYVKFLEEQIKRLELIEKYANKANNAKRQSQKDYYTEGMKMLFKKGENFENYSQILAEYKQALISRNELIDRLYLEIKIIKKLKIK